MSLEKNIYSMTGYGRASMTLGTVIIGIECKSLNSRYLEVSCKLPRLYNPLELQLRQFIQTYISRGRFELLVSRRLESTQDEGDVVEQSQLLSETKKKLGEVEAQYLGLGVTFDNSQRFEIARQLLSSSRVVDSSNEDEILSEFEAAEIKKALEVAVLQLQKQRSDEGQRLLQDLNDRISQLIKDVSELKKKAAEIPKLLSERMSERIKTSLASLIEIDPARLLQEVALLVDKADVTEELVRLESHLELFKDTLRAGGLVGKRLDFVCQEIFRELNTLGGKSASAEIQAIVVTCKVELERIREQVQNLE